MIIRYPLNVCHKWGTNGSQYITFADKKFTFSTYYATTDCTGTAPEQPHLIRTNVTRTLMLAMNWLYIQTRKLQKRKPKVYPK